MLCQFLLHNEVSQLCGCIYPFPLGMPFQHSIQVLTEHRAPCVIQQVPTSYLFYTRQYVAVLLHCWWECKPVQPLQRTVWSLLEKLKRELLYDPAIPLMGIYPEKTIINFLLQCMHACREGNGNLLRYSCLENPMDGGAWQAAAHGVAESDMTEVTQQQQQHACLLA